MKPADLIRKRLDIRFGDIPPYTGWAHSTRETLYEIFAELGYKKGAEIGVHRGQNAAAMCERIPGLWLLMVDPNQALPPKETPGSGIVRWPIAQISMEAVKDVDDGFLDFVYIDALHDFDNVMQDLIHWTPKVKKGGIVAGHDYYYSQTCHVPMAVDAYTRAHNIHDWYLTTDNRAKSGKYPYSPSFFWVR